MAIGGMTPYGPSRDNSARMESVRPVERRKDDREAEAGARPAPACTPQPAAAKPGTGRLVDLFV